MSNPEDQERLIRSLQRRDEAAFARMVREYQDRVFALVFRMLGDRAEAEDVSQEVFVTVFKAIDSFRGDSQFSTWLFRIAANHCRNRLRYLSRRNYHRGQSLDEMHEGEYPVQLSEQVPQPDRILEGAQLEKTIQDALNALDEDQRLIVVLRDLEHLSYGEIAQILDVAEGTVKSRLFRARLALRELISRGYPL
ncbi:MAG: sigma-70 family RNA polymerase sigma factor [Myxococcales bacterium]|jgi:RNA polymerase sigma-70 factor (ECF subfamily)|nr:sigma-70 family RNA polymerase sigma factor [Myxococcales bacterium]